MTSLRVLISGAGIGGPAAAFWLARMGCDVTIVERGPHLRTTGQQVDLRGQGIVVMKMMGIEPAIRAATCSEPGMRLIDRQGRSKAFFPAGPAGRDSQQGPTSEIEIMRGDLVNILYDATKDLKGVKYIFDYHIRSFVQGKESPSGKVHVTFSDGKEDDYDILIGADGVGSETRKHMLGPSFPDPRHDLGFHMAFFTAPGRDDDSKDWTICHLPGGKIIMTRKDKPENVRVYLASRGGCDAVDSSKTLAEQKAALAEQFKGAEGWRAKRHLQDLMESPEADDLYSQHMTQIRLPEGAWSRGRVALVGDAAYCPTPFGQGVGTTAALIGAYILAGEISKRWEASGRDLGRFSVEEASKEYERILRPFITEMQKVPSWVMRMGAPDSKLGIRALHLMARTYQAVQYGKSSGKSASKDADPVEELEYADYFDLRQGN